MAYARLDVLDEFWINEFDFETFKKKIEEVDRSFRKRKGSNLN